MCTYLAISTLNMPVSRGEYTRRVLIPRNIIHSTCTYPAIHTLAIPTLHAFVSRAMYTRRVRISRETHSTCIFLETHYLDYPESAFLIPQHSTLDPEPSHSLSLILTRTHTHALALSLAFSISLSLSHTLSLTSPPLSHSLLSHSPGEAQKDVPDCVFFDPEYLGCAHNLKNSAGVRQSRPDPGLGLSHCSQESF